MQTITSAKARLMAKLFGTTVWCKSKDLLGGTGFPCGREPPFPRVDGEFAAGDGHLDR